MAFTKGQIVRFVWVIAAGDESARMVVIEDRGDRVLVSDLSHSDWAIVPTAVYPASELVAVHD